MKIGILTTFFSYDPAYSLCQVVESQLKMLVNNKYEVILFANKGFKPPVDTIWEKVELRELPSVFTTNEIPMVLPKNFDSDVEKMYDTLKKQLQDIDVCLTHDIIFQSAHVVHNIAARKIASENSNIWFLNFVHSTSRPMFSGKKALEKYNLETPFPNSYLVYPNSGDIKRVAVNFKMDEGKIKVVPHPIDVYSHFKFEQLTIDICERYKLLDADILGIYPIRLDRGKQPHLVIDIFAMLNKMGRNAKLLIFDFHSTGGDKVKYREEMMDKIRKLGLSDKINFISQFSNKTASSVPHKVISDLFNITNVFILTSVSETYSLITQEAALAGNMLILNYDFPPLKSVYGASPFYFQFSSSINVLTGEDGSTTTNITDPDNFFGVIARNIIFEVDNNRSLQLKTFIRKMRNIQSVYENYLGPLIANCLYSISPIIKQNPKKAEKKVVESKVEKKTVDTAHDDLAVVEEPRFTIEKVEPLVDEPVPTLTDLIRGKPLEENPKVEKVFIIPAFKHFGLLQRNIESIKKYNTDYKIIVIDQTKDGLVGQKYKDEFDIIRAENYQLGFAASMNAGAILAREKYSPKFYIFSNEDVEFFDTKWWPGIIETFEAYKWKPAAVNPSSHIEPDGSFIKQWKLKDKEPTHDELVHSGAPTINGICMWCSVVPAEALGEIGLFDEKFYPGGGEDYDWNRRAYLKGYMMLGTHRSWAIHWWNRHNKKWGGSNEVEVLPTNTKKIWNNFNEKWGKDADIYGARGFKIPWQENVNNE